MADRRAVLTTIYEALGTADIDTMRMHVSDDVEVVERLEVPGANVYRGIDDWERGYAQEGETIDDFQIELLGVEEIGGRCVADVMVRMRGRSSGAEVEERLAHIIDFDGDKVSRWRAVSELDGARATARQEYIAELYGMWAGGDLDAALGHVHPEIEWAEPQETIGSRRGVGRERAREGVEQWAASFDSFGGEVAGLEAVGDRVIVEFVQRVRAGGSSVELETPVFHVWGFRDGLAASMQMYFERDQALQAAKS